MMTEDAPWWRSGVLYQIHPRSFADSNGDGIGDLGGIIDHFDHLQWLGIDGIWLSPITVSPNVDWGYDVADYCAVQPDYGTLDDVDTLVLEAGRRGIRVVLDLVPNHTSDHHQWFVDARSSRHARHRDWYVWADPRPDGSPPNNWVSAFTGPAWTLDEGNGQYYLHNYSPAQPDLNWWNDEVRSAFDDIQRFWYDRGIAGFRIDVCHAIVKDAELRDNPPAREQANLLERILGQQAMYNANRDEVHDVLRRWRTLADAYDPPRMLLGETVVSDLDTLARFYGTGEDELHLALNVPFQEAPFDARALRNVVETTESLLPSAAWPLWSGSNHDIARMASRWGDGEPAKVRAALLMVLTLRGTPLLFQGDEIGLVDTELTRDDLRDPVGELLYPFYVGRDPARTPMPWDDTPGGGFTEPGVSPWLPFGDLGAHNVAAQREDPASVLQFTRDLIALRRRSPDLRSGLSSFVDAAPGVLAWRRGDSTRVAINLSDSAAVVEAVDGRVAISAERRRDGERVAGRLELEPWDALVLETP